MKQVFDRLTVLPRWVVLIIDLILVFISVCIAYLLRFNFDFREIIAFRPLYSVLVCVITALVASLLTRNYAGIVRYTGIEDGLRIIRTELINVGLLIVANLVFFYNSGKNLLPYSVIFISFFISSLLLYQYRLLVKNIFALYKAQSSSRLPVVIFGAGVAGFLTKQAIDSDIRGQYKLVAFLDDDSKKNNKAINGVKVFHTSRLREVVLRSRVKKIIIAVKDISTFRKNVLVDEALKYNVRVSFVPSFEKWLRHDWDVDQIKDINIEDLLGREEIKLNNVAIASDVQGKTICISGAAGSIGSELSRQILTFHPKTLVLIDQAESPLYEIERELRAKNRQTRIIVFVADICNRDRINAIMKDYPPEMIFHAAAYKHVPLMESNPSEAVSVNIFGTKNLADLAVKHRVRKFVMISTDKAVNPTNIMGCTKRIAEIYVQSLDHHLRRLSLGNTSFVTTRFGNVLGSNGSVIPIFKDQIAKGGPLTVTHPEITRFFMTIPEACELVIEAGVMGQGGEIYIFDMGKPVKIYDLAKKMVMLSGKQVGKDIDIIFTGLRDGEKLYEELLNDEENTIPTHHQKILKAKVSVHPYEETERTLGLLEEFITDRNELKMVALMKEIVPEYKSNYSRFEVLDNGQFELN